jgi:hypothetical protein
MSLRYGIGIPQIFPDGSFSPDDFRAYLARAESLGVYESGWLMEPQPAAFVDQVAVVRSELAKTGRQAGFGPGEYPVAKRIYIGIDSARS